MSSNSEPLSPPLPQGWKKAIDKESGDAYYYNRKTSETTWDRPASVVPPVRRTSVDSYFQPQRNNNEAEEEEEEEDGTRGGDHRVTWSDHHHHTAADPDSPSVFYDAEGHSAESPTHHHATTATTSSTSTAANAGSSRPQQRRSINIGTSYYNQPGYQQQRQHDVSTAIPDNEEVEFASVYTAPTVVLTTAEGEGGAHPHHDEQHPDEQGGGVLMMHAGGTSPAEHHHLRHGEDRRSGSSISEYQHNDYYTHLEKTNSCESPRLTVTVASTSTPPHGTDGGVERSSPPTEDGGGGTSSSSSTYHNPEHGAGGGKGVASKGGRAVDGSGGETAERPPQTIEQLLHGKAYGECLTRISLRSQIFRDWKPCLWVFESQDTLLVFRSRIDYMGFHCNPFIDAPTKAYMIKTQLDFQQRAYCCLPLLRKRYSGRILSTFTVEEIKDFGPVTAAKFAGTDEEEMVRFRQIVVEAILRNQGQHLKVQQQQHGS